MFWSQHDDRYLVHVHMTMVLKNDVHVLALHNLVSKQNEVCRLLKHCYYF